MKILKKLVSLTIGTAMAFSVSTMAFGADYAGFYKEADKDAVSMVTLAVNQDTVEIDEDAKTVTVKTAPFELEMYGNFFDGALTGVYSDNEDVVSVDFSYNPETYEGILEVTVTDFFLEVRDLFDQENYVLFTVQYEVNYSGHPTTNTAYFGLSHIYPEYN